MRLLFFVNSLLPPLQMSKLLPSWDGLARLSKAFSVLPPPPCVLLMVISVSKFVVNEVMRSHNPSDDRVRAISLAMGMVPIIWTRGPTGVQFDTNGKKLLAFYYLNVH